MDLPIEADALTVGLKMADSVKAKGRIQKMLALQMALHSAGLQFLGKARHERAYIKEASVFNNDLKRQLAWVEAARMMNAAARAFSAFNDGALTCNV